MCTTLEWGTAWGGMSWQGALLQWVIKARGCAQSFRCSFPRTATTKSENQFSWQFIRCIILWHCGSNKLSFAWCPWCLQGFSSRRVFDRERFMMLSGKRHAASPAADDFCQPQELCEGLADKKCRPCHAHALLWHRTYWGQVEYAG